ncbi:MAG: hypothetical protein HRT61_02915 [Ekhidna sp.]|nr:hypothetical protein [Ekhidna sp.]
MILQYKNALNLLYGGKIGDILYDFAIELCEKSFKNKISPEIPIILTTAMSPYNRFAGWYSDKSHTIELARHYCYHGSDGIRARSIPEMLATLAHEFCHVYQYQVLGGRISARGPHRCKSWYQSITLASPFVCGVDIEGICIPSKSVREGEKVYKVNNPNSLTEVELTHFPDSIIKLAKADDRRLKGRLVGKPAV